MYSLRLLAKDCISCGICMDVCGHRAIAMRTVWSRSPEGKILTHRFLDSPTRGEPASAQMMTFPYLARPELCDGCQACVDQCPVNALVLEAIGSPLSHGSRICHAVS